MAGLGLIGAVLLWLAIHDRKVVDQHEGKIAAQVTAATQAANDVANANDTRRQVEDAKAAALTEEAIRAASSASPEAARAPAGPVSNAVADRLRARAAAARAAAGREGR